MNRLYIHISKKTAIYLFTQNIHHKESQTTVYVCSHTHTIMYTYINIYIQRIVRYTCTCICNYTHAYTHAHIRVKEQNNAYNKIDANNNIDIQCQTKRCMGFPASKAMMNQSKAKTKESLHTVSIVMK